MSTINFDSAPNDAMLTPAKASMQAFKQHLRERYFGDKFRSREIGDSKSGGNNGIIIEKTELIGKSGTEVSVRLRERNNSAGRVGDDTLEGREEGLTWRNCTVKAWQRRNAFKVKGTQTEQGTEIPIRAEARDEASTWMAEANDFDACNALSGTELIIHNDDDDTDITVVQEAKPHADRHFIGGQSWDAGSGKYIINNRANHGAITANDRFGTLVIEEMLRRAKKRLPSVGSMRPIKYKGETHFILFAHPDQLYDLSCESRYESMMAAAAERGKKNPMLSGCVAWWKGVAIFEYDAIQTRSTGQTYNTGDTAVGAGVDTARALLCGAGGAIYASTTKRPTWKEKAFDYDDKWGVAVKHFWGYQKAMFNGYDYGVVTADTAIVSV